MSRLRRLRIGPTFLIALVLSGLLLWWKHTQDQRPRGPVIVERQTVATSGRLGAVAPDFVLARATALGLSTDQREQAGRLAEEWERETAGLQQQLDVAAAALQDKLQHAAIGKLTRADYQAEAAQVQAFSRRLSALRQVYWTRLQAILTPDQQRRAKQAWAEAHQLTVAAPGE